MFNLFSFLSQQSDLAVFTIVNIILIFISLLFLVIIRHFFKITGTDEDNAVIANISSIVGIIYGVLAGLSALYLLNNVDRANDAVQREASAAANIYQDTKFIKEPVRGDMQKQLNNYLKTVLNKEWTMMANGSNIIDEKDNVITQMIDSLSTYTDKQMIDSAMLVNLLDDIKALRYARDERIQLSKNTLSSEIWDVVLIGTFLTIIINFFFRMSYRIHLIALLAEIIMASSIIFLLITLDTPFQGEYVVQPEAFQSLLNRMEEN